MAESLSQKEQFIKAVKEDEYAELELDTGDVLITDWEGDGVFNPYVVVKNNNASEEDVAEAIEDVFGIYPSLSFYDREMEYYDVRMKRPQLF